MSKSPPIEGKGKAHSGRHTNQDIKDTEAIDSMGGDVLYNITKKTFLKGTDVQKPILFKVQEKRILEGIKTRT